MGFTSDAWHGSQMVQPHRTGSARPQLAANQHRQALEIFEYTKSIGHVVRYVRSVTKGSWVRGAPPKAMGTKHGPKATGMKRTTATNAAVRCRAVRSPQKQRGHVDMNKQLFLLAVIKVMKSRFLNLKMSSAGKETNVSLRLMRTGRHP